MSYCLPFSVSTIRLNCPAKFVSRKVSAAVSIKRFAVAGQMLHSDTQTRKERKGTDSDETCRAESTEFEEIPRTPNTPNDDILTSDDVLFLEYSWRNIYFTDPQPDKEPVGRMASWVLRRYGEKVILESCSARIPRIGMLLQKHPRRPQSCNASDILLPLYARDNQFSKLCRHRVLVLFHDLGTLYKHFGSSRFR